MSLLLVNKVKPLALPFGPKSILHWLADESRDSETVTFGMHWLAALAGCSERTAQNHVRYLEDKGILISIPSLVGRGKYPSYRINLDVILPERTPGKPRGIRKTKFEKTAEEPPRSPIPMPPARADVAPAAPAQPGGQDIAIDVAALQSRRATILANIQRAQSGDRYALQWWERNGEAATQTLTMINQMLGLEAEMELEVQQV